MGGMIGSLVGGGLAVGSAIFGGISNAIAANRQRKAIEAVRKEQKQIYENTMNEDATQRADAQRLLTMTEQSLRNSVNRANGAAAVGGASEESVAAAKAAANQTLADTVSSINAQNDARKDAAQQQYLAGEQAFVNQLNNLESSKMAATAQAVQGVAQAGGNIASAFGK